MFRKGVLATALASAAAIVSVPAHALTFNLINTGGAEVGTQARAGFEAAASYWSSVLTDNVTVNLDIGFASLGGSILGQTGSTSAVALTKDVYTALGNDKTSALDNTAVADLKALTKITSGTYKNQYQLGMTVNTTSQASANKYSDQGTRVDNDGTVNNIALSVNTANMKALGLTTDANGAALDMSAADGSVTFSSDFAFDFDPTDGITTGYSDFIGVAIHEIGHALGFVSGVDEYDYFTYNIAAATNTSKKGPLDGYAVGSVLDLFRYSSTGTVDWSTSSADKYFSVDGGATKFNGDASFALGYYNGDGDQASHWKENGTCSGFVGVMNPYLCDGTGAIMTGNDLGALDAIGWDLATDARSPSYTATTADVYRAFHANDPIPGGVPEPASWAMMLAGFGLVGGAMRRRVKVGFAL